MKFEHSGGNPEIREGDIVFECPYCGKSLAIDPAGAGMQVVCTDCGKAVLVPSADDAPPAAEEVLTPREAEEAIARLDEALTSSADRLEALSAQNETLQERRAYLEHMLSVQNDRFAKMSALLDGIQKQLDELAGLVADARTGRPG